MSKALISPTETIILNMHEIDIASYTYTVINLVPCISDRGVYYGHSDNNQWYTLSEQPCESSSKNIIIIRDKLYYIDNLYALPARYIKLPRDETRYSGYVVDDNKPTLYYQTLGVKNGKIDTFGANIIRDKVTSTTKFLPFSYLIRK